MHYYSGWLPNHWCTSHSAAISITESLDFCLLGPTPAANVGTRFTFWTVSNWELERWICCQVGWPVFSSLHLVNKTTIGWNEGNCNSNSFKQFRWKSCEHKSFISNFSLHILGTKNGESVINRLTRQILDLVLWHQSCLCLGALSFPRCSPQRKLFFLTW